MFRTSRAADMLGKRFGKLVVQKRMGSDDNGRALWWVRCDCGNGKKVRGDSLRRGATTSCGKDAHAKRKRK